MTPITRTIGLNLAAIVVFAILYFVIGRSGTDFEGLKTPLDALYFSTTVQSSVGFGDVTPTSSRAKMLVMMQQFLLIIGVVDLLSAGAVTNAITKNVVNAVPAVVA